MSHGDLKNGTLNSLFSADVISPGYIESIATSKRKSKEVERTDQLIPSEILENAQGIKTLLDAYYTFMNLKEFVYQENETFSDIILDNRAVFRIPDPTGNNNRFFTDETGTNSVLTITDLNDVISVYPLTEVNVAITNGNELPGSLAESTSEIGKTFTVTGLDAYNAQTATLTTIVKYWVGPGPSYVLNTIEEAMDIDTNAENYLELMQKEIAAVIPRSLTVNKRNLYKNILDYYRIRGSSDSVEVFFRLLFNEEVEVEYPYNETLIPSSGLWEPNPALPRGGQYLDNKGFLSYNIKLQDSYRYQKFSYMIRTGKNVSEWEDVFNRLVHPAGFIFFGEILILIEMTKAAVGEADALSAVEQNNLVRLILSAMPEFQPGVIGLEDIPLLVEAFASVFLPYIEPKIHRSATLSIALDNLGSLESVEVGDMGWGYTSTPNVTFIGQPLEGQTLVPPTITLNMDAYGQVDSVTIDTAGSGYSSLFATIDANPDIGKIADVFVSGQSNKNYKTAPTIVFPAPTSKDVDGNFLSTNVTATAEFVLNVDNEISGVIITNPGNGYITDPTARMGSSANNELRGKDIEPILILPLNHIPGLSRTYIENNYFNLKGQTYFNSSKKYDFNATIETFGSSTIESTDTTVINKYNVNSFITGKQL